MGLKRTNNMNFNNGMPNNNGPMGDPNGAPNGGFSNNGMPNGGAPMGGMPNNNGMPMGGKGPKPMKTPKIKKEKAQNVTKYSHTRNVILLLVAVVVIIIAVNVVSSLSLRKTISVVSLNSSVVQGGIITQDNMVELELTNKDFEKIGLTQGDNQRRQIVLWDERESLVNKYAAYYIRRGTPVYIDAISTDSTKQYSYLYNMDGELLKIAMDADTFGQMLVPGDHINVRAAYQESVFTLPTEDELILQQQTGISPQTTVQRQILLFNNAAVLDILNSAGESIYDKYYEVLELPKSQQAEVLNSEDFMSSVEPAEILLNVTPEEADRYMSIQMNGPTYMMTLLPRTSSNAITEMLNELAVGYARD